ncbi:MAG: proton-conducting membrane transporter [Deltaproteobacteria bacterium]|nr:proton-conducting membrane transporter [Deltaproteobacteria bacterium]
MTGILLAIPVLLAGVVLAIALPHRHARVAAALISQGVAIVLVLLEVVPVLAGGADLHATWPWSFPIEDIRFHVDALGAFFLAWSLPMTLVGSIYAIGYLKPYVAAGRNAGPHFALLNLVSLSFVVVYSVQNALVFLLGWEIAAVSAWLLVIWDYRSQKIRFAGFNYLVSTHVGLFVLVSAFMLMHGKSDSMDFGAWVGFLHKPSGLRSMVFALLAVAFALKSAYFPFHTWLPRAHAAAPAHVSALMSGVIHKAGLFGLLRFTLLMGKPEEWMGWAVLAMGAASALFGALSTASQRDLKRLLGYSSTENVGIAAIGFGVGYLGLTWNAPALVLAGFGGGLFHLLNHALFKCLLFYAAGAVYRVTHTVDLERLGGLWRVMPATGAMFLLGGLAISALPPFNGFLSEFLIYGGLVGGGAPTIMGDVALAAMAAVLAFVGATSALAITRAFGVAFLGVARDPKIHATEPVPRTLLATMVVHAAAIVVVGLVPLVGLALVQAPVALFTGPDAPPLARSLDAVLDLVRVLAALLAVLGVLGWWIGRRARRHVTWGCGFAAPSPRMQYTASSFAAQFNRIFEAVMPVKRRETLPRAVFPTQPGQLSTSHVDAVERRMFEVLGQNEQMAVAVSKRVPEQPRIAFAIGLVVLVGIVVAVVGGLP